MAAVCAWRRGGLGGGVRVLAAGPSACWNLGFLCRPLLLFPWPVVGRQWFMGTGCGDDMSKADFLRGSSEGSCFLRGRQSALIACLSVQRGVHIVRTLSTGGSSACILVPSSWFCLHYFMQFSVSDDMTLWLRSSVSLDVPGSAGTSLGLSAAVASGPSTESGCVGSGLFFLGRSWFS